MIKAVQHWFKFKLAKLLLISLISATMALATGCGRNESDYLGVWICLDENTPQKVVHEFNIEAAGNGSYNIIVTNMYYQINANQTGAKWVASNPNVFRGYIDKRGDMVTNMGKIKAKPGTFQLVYGDLFLTRKAKNTELKLKYVIRDDIAAKYPNMVIVD